MHILRKIAVSSRASRTKYFDVTTDEFIALKCAARGARFLSEDAIVIAYEKNKKYDCSTSGDRDKSRRSLSQVNDCCNFHVSCLPSTRHWERENLVRNLKKKKAIRIFVLITNSR